jgi:hypothetical protein
MHRRERQMTTAPVLLDSGAVLSGDAVHVTGRRVVATIIDGLIFGTVYWLLALTFGDIRTEGEAANWASNLPVWASVAYGLFVVGYYVLLEGYLGSPRPPSARCCGSSTASSAIWWRS